MSPVASPLVILDGVSVSRRGAGAPLVLVADASFTIGRGEIVCLVGESGSGKTLTGQAMIGLAQETGLAVGGRLTYAGEDLSAAGVRRFRALRRSDFAAVWQDPSSSLDPVFSVGSQLVEVVRQDRTVPKSQARRRAIELLEMVGLDEPVRRMRQYPHELSGGMCQRVGIALALAAGPKLLVADEPTSALDVTLRAQILDLLEMARRERGLSILLITHDMHVAAAADRLVVLYAGAVVETGEAEEMMTAPRHPYTAGLLASVPSLEGHISPGDRLPVMVGGAPSPGHRLPGCAFAPRCPLVQERCIAERPPLMTLGPAGARSACWRAAELPASLPLRVRA
jgi:oligopeptide/dipeptide ABC transporter ATP-binding protein